MANVKITDLPALTNPDSTDVLPIVNANVTKKVSVGEVVGKISGDVDVATDGTSSIASGVIVNDDINASAAIAGTKIDPDFGSQTVETTGDLAINTDVLFVNSAASSVGVGTANPITKLHIVGAGAPTLRIEDADGTAQFLNVFHNNGLTSFDSKDEASDGQFRFRGGSTLNEYVRIDDSGHLLVGTSSQSGGSLFQVNDDRIRIASSKTPASASDTGTAGEVCWDADYIYVAVGTNTWKRAALSSW